MLRARSISEVLDAIEKVISTAFSEAVQTLRVLDDSLRKQDENPFATQSEKQRVQWQRALSRARCLELLDMAQKLADVASVKYGQQWRFRAVLDRKNEVAR